MKKETTPFEIPAIDNRKAALALYLGLDSENDHDWGSIKAVEKPVLATHEQAIAKSASVFEFRNARYYVDHISSDMEADSVIAFNSNQWKIKKAPASVIDGGLGASSPWSIKDPKQLPADARKVAIYDYLNTAFQEMWLEGLDVAHRLIEQHAEQHDNATYYQDTFGADYIAALANPRLEGGIVFDEMADPAQAHLHRNDQPSWQAFKQASERLKSLPRGSIALLGADNRWHIRIHGGGGYVSDCKTMRNSGPKPTAREIHECLLSTESYLAKHQAQKEREILANFASLRALKLQRGHRVRNVKALHNGKTRSINFTVKSISETGYVLLGDGTLVGSSQRFTHTVPACEISEAQLIAPEPKKALAPVDLDTAQLF